MGIDGIGWSWTGFSWDDLMEIFKKNGAWTVKKSILGLNVEKMDENGALPRNGDEMEATYC